MCSVSMVTNDWMKDKYKYIYPYNEVGPTFMVETRAELEYLKNELLKLKEELKKARQKDIEENVEDCENKEAIDLIKNLAKQLNINLEDVFDGHK